MSAMPIQRVTLPAEVLPGAVPNKLIELIEDTMNSTIRECVFVTEHLDNGAIEDAFSALLQIKENAIASMELIEKELAHL